MELNIFETWPVTADLLNVFHSHQGCTVPSTPGVLTMNGATSGGAYWVRQFPTPPKKLVAFQVEWKVDAGATPVLGDTVEFQLRGATATGDPTVLASLSVIFGSYTGSTSSDSLRLITNTSTTAQNFPMRCKVSGSFLSIIATFYFDPIARTVNASVGDDMDSSITIPPHEKVFNDAHYTGIPFDLAMRMTSTATGRVIVRSVHLDENPYAHIGDSVAYWQHAGFGRYNLYSGTDRSIRYTYCGQMSQTLEHLLDNDHWKKQTINRGFKKIIVGNIGTEDMGTAGGHATAYTIKQRFRSLLLALYQLNLEHVIVCSIAPRGATSARDAESIAAVTEINNYLSELCSLFRFSYADVHAVASTGDNWLSAYSSNGIVPDIGESYLALNPIYDALPYSLESMYTVKELNGIIYIAQVSYGYDTGTSENLSDLRYGWFPLGAGVKPTLRYIGDSKYMVLFDYLSHLQVRVFDSSTWPPVALDPITYSPTTINKVEDAILLNTESEPCNGIVYTHVVAS